MVTAGIPDGVGMSRLRVYTWPTPDGLHGGTPHIHLACSETCVVTGGHGLVQTLTLTEGYQETSLDEGDLVWFTPGTIHRLINLDGALDIVVIMQNSGLPESGDAVFTFPPGTLSDARAYAEATSIVDAAGAESEELAKLRRDRAIEGFAILRAAAEAGDLAPLHEFHRHAAALVQPHVDRWRALWERGPVIAVSNTEVALTALPREHYTPGPFGAVQGQFHPPARHVRLAHDIPPPTCADAPNVVMNCPGRHRHRRTQLFRLEDRDAAPAPTGCLSRTSASAP